MKLLLVEPYFGGSHRAWAEGYRRHSAHEVRLVTHPAAWWKWRMRGSAVTLGEEVVRIRSGGWEPDVVVVTDMVDLPALRWFAGLDRVPVALYLHETQLTYPDAPGAEPDVSYAFTNWLSALAADVVLFNSGYHLETFFEELPRLLRHFPDRTHEHLIDGVRAKSEVLPVGVELGWAPDLPVPKPGPPLVVWNHRWEHDTGPEEFVDAAVAARSAGEEFRLALCGPRFRQVPDALARARAELGDLVVHDGHAPVEEYRRLLVESAVVVSAARQEFFGISVVEAMAAGARPVLPDRLSYPWLIPPEFHAGVLYPEEGLAAALVHALGSGPAPDGLRHRAREFSWDRLAGRYDEVFSLARRGKTP